MTAPAWAFWLISIHLTVGTALMKLQANTVYITLMWNAVYAVLPTDAPEIRMLPFLFVVYWSATAFLTAVVWWTTSEYNPKEKLRVTVNSAAIEYSLLARLTGQYPQLVTRNPQGRVITRLQLKSYAEMAEYQKSIDEGNLNFSEVTNDSTESDVQMICNESVQKGSTVETQKQCPRSVVQVMVTEKDNKPVQYGVMTLIRLPARLGRNRVVMITATHVLDSVAHAFHMHPNATVRLVSMENPKLNVTWTRTEFEEINPLFYSTAQDFDLTMFEPYQKWQSQLGLRASKVGRARHGMQMAIPIRDDHNRPAVSRPHPGFNPKPTMIPLSYTHGCTTVEGMSGSPLFNTRGLVVGIHRGASNNGPNVAADLLSIIECIMIKRVKHVIKESPDDGTPSLYTQDSETSQEYQARAFYEEEWYSANFGHMTWGDIEMLEEDAREAGWFSEEDWSDDGLTQEERWEQKEMARAEEWRDFIDRTESFVKEAPICKQCHANYEAKVSKFVEKNEGKIKTLIKSIDDKKTSTGQLDLADNSGILRQLANDVRGLQESIKSIHRPDTIITTDETPTTLELPEELANFITLMNDAGLGKKKKLTMEEIYAAQPALRQLKEDMVKFNSAEIVRMANELHQKNLQHEQTKTAETPVDAEADHAKTITVVANEARAQRKDELETQATRQRLNGTTMKYKKFRNRRPTGDNLTDDYNEVLLTRLSDLIINAGIELETQNYDPANDQLDHAELVCDQIKALHTKPTNWGSDFRQTGSAGPSSSGTKPTTTETSQSTGGSSNPGPAKKKKKKAKTNMDLD